MSRIGRLPVVIPEKVEIKVDENNCVIVKGPKGELKQQVNKNIEIKVENGEVKLTRKNEESETKAMHGLYRTLVNNMVKGVTEGYKKSLIINGVGYKVAKQGKKVVFNIGYSHPIEMEEVDGIKLECPSITEVTVEGIDKEKVGQFAASIRALRNPDPYHAYGIRYSDEVIQRKEGKTAGK